MTGCSHPFSVPEKLASLHRMIETLRFAAEFGDAVLGLKRDTVSYGIGSNGENTEMLSISFCKEPSNYQKIICWIRLLFFNAIHDSVRLRTSLAKIMADIPHEKRDGDRMLVASYCMLACNHNSSARAQTTLSKASRLGLICKLLEDSPEEVLIKFSQLCAALHRLKNFRITVAADIETLKNPASSWAILTDSLGRTGALEPLDDCRVCLSEIGNNPGSTAFIIPISALGSCFVMLVSNGPDAYSSTDYLAFLIAKSYMNTVKGPLWAAVRGNGLAYHTYLSHSSATGNITLRIVRSPDAYKAYAAAKDQVEGYSSGRLPLDQGSVRGAVSKIILDLVNEQPTISAAAELSYVNQVIRGTKKDHSRDLLERVHKVTPDQIFKAMKKYMLLVFEPQAATLIVTCAESMSMGVLKDFKGAGFDTKIRTLDQFQD